MNSLLKKSLFVLAVFGCLCSFSHASDWNEETNPSGNTLRSVRFLNGSWIAVGEKGTLLWSDDGRAWTQTAPFSSFDFTDAAYGNGVYVIGTAGAGAAFNSPQDPARYVSTDGQHWSPVKSIVGSVSENVFTFDRLTFEAGVFVGIARENASGSEGTYRWAFAGQNGSDWDSTTMLPGTYEASATDLTSGKGRIVVVGAVSTAANPNNALLASSTDARSWTNEPSPDPAEWHADGGYLLSPALTFVAFTGDQFVALGVNRRAVSTDGLTWTKSTPGNQVVPLAYSQGIFYGQLTVGDATYLELSTDGLAWSQGAQVPAVLTALMVNANVGVGISGNRIFTLTAVNSRLANLSSINDLAPSGPTVTAGLVITGGPRRVLLRGIGPGLVPYGISAPLADPQLSVYNLGTLVTQIGLWSTAANKADIAATAQTVGAFSLDEAKADSAGLLTLQPEVYSVILSSVSGGSGTALVETYDASPDSAPGRLVNQSALLRINQAGHDAGVGFVVTGGSPRTYLLRAVGPTLASLGYFAMNAVLPDPILTVHAGSKVIASDDDWNDNVSKITAQVGAFPLTAGSKDAALIMTLPPGVYSMRVADKTGGTGTTIIEIYEVPAGTVGDTPGN